MTESEIEKIRGIFKISNMVPRKGDNSEWTTESRRERQGIQFPIFQHIYISRTCDWLDNVQYTSFPISKWNIFPKGKLQLDQNSNACMSRQYHLLLWTVCLIQDYRTSSLTACSLKGSKDADRSQEFWSSYQFLEERLTCSGAAIVKCPSEFINECLLEWMT